jgi:uncharacterized repeat protein (TIGR03803 family)
MPKNLSLRLAALAALTFVLISRSTLSWAGTETVLHTFTGGQDGAAPSPFLVSDAAGNLYGTTYGGGLYRGGNCFDGCGVVFKLSPNSSGGWTESVLYNFKGGSDGQSPEGVVFDAAGNLYGTTGGGGNQTCDGGAFFCGTVFKLTHNANGSWSESILYAFNGSTDGGVPGASVFVDAAGNLYGTTVAYGLTTFGAECISGCGVVFKLSPTTSGTYTYSVLYSFAGGADGALPRAALTMDASGNLYGTATEGGDFTACGFSGCGTIFELSPSGGSWNFQVLYNFTNTSTSGVFPASGLTLDAAGNLYGTAAYGGPTDAGVAYKLTKSANWQQSVLQTFPFGTSGIGSPSGALIFDSAGNLYGATGGTSSKNEGALYKLSPAAGGSWKLIKLYNGFVYGLGAGPIGPLVLGSGGAIYGTTLEGGVIKGNCRKGCGVVYKIAQ